MADTGTDEDAGETRSVAMHLNALEIIGHVTFGYCHESVIRTMTYTCTAVAVAFFIYRQQFYSIFTTFATYINYTVSPGIKMVFILFIMFICDISVGVYSVYCLACHADSSFQELLRLFIWGKLKMHFLV